MTELTELKALLNNDCDSYVFLPTEDETIHVQASEYKDKGIKLDGSPMGDCYHIILFREDEEGELVDVDKFEGILTAPVEYIMRMIKEDWFGVVCRKTTTSDEFVNNVFAKLQEV